MADALDRFVIAQAGVYDRALAELSAGEKRTHWMWFVFPQIGGLGTSAMAVRYAIADLGEARGYLAHRVLGPRLIESSSALLGWACRRSADAILGTIDATKLRSSMTLFESVGGDAVFGRIIDEFFGGERDDATLARIRPT